MDELRESSLLFSLEGLLETERERVQREAREAERRREEELERVAAAAERRRAALEQEREARARREGLERERERLEEERRQAMTRATVERARIEAEAAVQLVEAEERRKHELLLAKLHGDSRTARYRALAWVGAGASVFVAISALAAYFGWIRPAQAAQVQRYEMLVAESLAREQAKNDALLERERRLESKNEALRTEQTKNEALLERLRVLESKAPVATPLPHGSAKLPPASGQTRVVPSAKKKPCRDSGDPLDTCLR